MEWIGRVLTSEFFWGIVIGLLLAIVVAAATIWLDSRRRRWTVAAFCQDLVGSVCDLINNLEDNRDRNRVIDLEFIETIAVEIGVYGRNREHLVVLADAKLRKDVREFFTRVAALLAQIRWRLGQFNEANQRAQAETDPLRQMNHKVTATGSLNEAHQACDRLREMNGRGEALGTRLDKFTRLWS